jgi:hypothetical protein
MCDFGLMRLRALWLAILCALLLPVPAAAQKTSIDLDGDGRRDHWHRDHREPTVLHVWLSATGTTQTIRARTPLVRVVARDLDGDHQPELIASDTQSQIHVWTRSRSVFQSYHPRRVAPAGLRQRPRRNIDDSDRDAEAAVTVPTFEQLSLVLSALPRGPGPAVVPALVPDTPRPFRSLSALEPFAPRPPPPPATD